MKHVALIAIACAALALAPTALPSAPKTSFAFGRSGGNIRPSTTTISVKGIIRVDGATSAGRGPVPAATRTSLRALVASVRFFSLPKFTNCAGAHPDVAARWVRVTSGDRTRTVTVHGGCVPRFQRLATALSNAVS